MTREHLGLGFCKLLAQANAHINRAEVLKQQLALMEAKAKEDLTLVEEKKKEELAQLVQVFTKRETRVLPLCTRVVELEEEAVATKAKMAKLEERATNQEVQLGRAEAELTQQAKTSRRSRRS